VEEVADVGRGRGLAGPGLVPEVNLEARPVLQPDHLRGFESRLLKRVVAITVRMS